MVQQYSSINLSETTNGVGIILVHIELLKALRFCRETQGLSFKDVPLRTQTIGD